MGFQPGIPLRKDEVLKRVTQEQIFERYLGLPVEEGKQFCNPLRLDNSPGCKYYYNAHGTLYFHDFGKHHWDCFNIVEFKFGIRFIEAIKTIINDFKLNGLQPIINPIERELKLKQRIQVTVREWNNDDLAYWNQYNIKQYQLNLYKVYACKNIWLNGELYKCKHNDPGYAFYFGNDLFKIYFPKRKDYGRFFQNITKDDNLLMGYSQLKDTDKTLIITKSYKDVMSLSSIAISAVSLISEAELLSEEYYFELKERFTNIYTLFDNDQTGRRATIRHQKAYNTIPLIFPWTMEKDFTDNVVRFGIDKMKEICFQIIK